MRAFYDEIMKRIDIASEGQTAPLTSLERIIISENMPLTEKLRRSEVYLDRMLRDMAMREAAAARFGDGEKDVFVSVFRDDLGPDRKVLEEYKKRALSDEEEYWIKRYERNGWAADVYKLLRQGTPPEELGAALGISEEEILDAYCCLHNAYENAARRCGELPRPNNRQLTPEIWTHYVLLMGHYRVFRQENTGETQYRFYHKGRLMGTGSAYIVPGFPLVLRCGGLILNSKFDPSRTVVPGVSREIVDADNATATVARLTWLGDSRYELTMNWDTGTENLEIQTDGQNHIIYRGGRRIAAIYALTDPQRLLEWEVNYCLSTKEIFTDETALLLMSFPLLRFAM